MHVELFVFKYDLKNYFTIFFCSYPSQPKAPYKVIVECGDSLVGDLLAVDLPWNQAGTKLYPEGYIRGFNIRLGHTTTISSLALSYWGQQDTCAGSSHAETSSNLGVDFI